MTSAQPPGPSLDAARARIIGRLGDHFAREHLTLQELEGRLERAYRATDIRTLDALVADLPAEPAPAAVERAAPGAPTRDRAPSKTILALAGGVVRRGRWLVPRRLRAVAIMGVVELDLRDAALGPGVTEIRALALMGAVVVRVPPGVILESDGVAILGGFEDQLRTPATGDANAPVVRVSGLALMGGVETKVAPSRHDAGAPHAG